MEGKELIQRVYENWNKKDKDGFLAYYTENSVITGPGVVLRGLAGAEMFWESWHDSFPGNHLTFHTIFATEIQIAVEATFEGTNTGTLHIDGRQLPPTGKYVSYPYVEIITVRDDKIVTHHLYSDQLELHTQLGLMPASGT